jgi:DNA polymerase I
MMFEALPFKYIVVADTEFEFGGHATPEDAGRSGERPRPVCIVAKELRTGQTWRLWRGEFGPPPPFPIGPDALFVAFYASAELGFFKALGWPMPARILDLYVEFRARTNGLATPAGSRLVGALAYFGLDTIGAEDKDAMITLILRGGPWSESERLQILDYCAGDTDALERLLPAMLPRIDLPRALLRGRYMAAAAAMEFAGVPIDAPTLVLLRGHWTDIQDDLIATIDADYHVFDGRSFRADRWAAYLTARGIPWPLLDTGHLDLSDETFRQMSRAHAEVSPVRELRHALSQLRLNDLAVGADARNRTILSAFRARTGRNQPSNARFIFGPSVWIRSLIQPPPGHGLAYCDWGNQEFGIAAALSGDLAMQEAYRTADPYMALAKRVGAIPPDGARADHEHTRQLFKAVVLGTAYGMSEWGLAGYAGITRIAARGLLQAHREAYRDFWKWSDAAVNCAMLHGSIRTVFGWPLHIGEDSNPRSIRNFPAQANAAELLRLACCLATERGIEVCAPVHDAVLICAPLDHFEDHIAGMRAAMIEASQIILGGFELRVDVKRIFPPDRFKDARGTAMWTRVMDLIAKRRAGLEARHVA